MSENRPTHTPGPLEIHSFAHDVHSVRTVASAWETAVCRTKANAQLYAAAPDLLAALEKVLSRIYLPEEWEQDVVDAIAKARGES